MEKVLENVMVILSLLYSYKYTILHYLSLFLALFADQGLACVVFMLLVKTLFVLHRGFVCDLPLYLYPNSTKPDWG